MRPPNGPSLGHSASVETSFFIRLYLMFINLAVIAVYAIINRSTLFSETKENVMKV
jgi:hypothetical protein